MRMLQLWILAGIVALGMSSTAGAGTALTLEEASAEPAPNECPPLTRIKYPWLDCAENPYGGRSFTTATVEANASWEADRVHPRGHGFVEGVGGWIHRER